MAYPPYPTGNIPNPPHVATDEHRADGDRAARVERFVGSWRWRRNPNGNATIRWHGRQIGVVRHEPGRYGYAIDRVWARGGWTTEEEAKRAAAAIVLALPHKERSAPGAMSAPGTEEHDERTTR